MHFPIFIRFFFTKYNDDDDDDDDDVDLPGRTTTGVGDARINELGCRAWRVAEPKKRYGSKKTEPRAAALECGRRDSAGDRGTQSAKRPNAK